jgi:hypothetical protein
MLRSELDDPPKGVPDGRSAIGEVNGGYRGGPPLLEPL